MLLTAELGLSKNVQVVLFLLATGVTLDLFGIINSCIYRYISGNKNLEEFSEAKRILTRLPLRRERKKPC